MRLAAGVCLLTWLALVVGLVAGVGFTPRLLLATLAAARTEGLIWLTGLLLGMNVYGARRHRWPRLRVRLVSAKAKSGLSPQFPKPVSDDDRHRR